MKGGPSSRRPVALGKFLCLGGEKLYLRGVTYGTFAPDASGCEMGSAERAARDLALMAASGVNALRTYTVPPRWLLDLAHAHPRVAFLPLTLRAAKPKPAAYPRQLSTLGDHLRKRRLDLGLLQKDVARRVGVKTPAVTAWELGQATPSAGYLPRIIRFLG